MVCLGSNQKHSLFMAAPLLACVFIMLCLHCVCIVVIVPCLQEDPAVDLLLDLPDGFARLIMHGLAQFHGL